MSDSEFHESFAREEKVSAGPARSLGFVFAAVCAIVGGLALWRGNAQGAYWLGGAGVFLLLALFWTAPLRPLNFLWFRLSLVLYHVVNPLVLGAMFYLAILPMGLLLRLFGKDLLRLKLQRDAATYWIARTPPGPAPESMKQQF